MYVALFRSFQVFSDDLLGTNYVGEMASSKYYNYPAGQTQQIKGGGGEGGGEEKGGKANPNPVSLFPSLLPFPFIQHVAFSYTIVHIFSALTFGPRMRVLFLC